MIRLNSLFNSSYKSISLFFILLSIVLLIASSIGTIPISILDVLNQSLTSEEKAILYFIRFPRILLGALVGAALAVSGAAIQGLFRNPLADPSLIGISSGAAFMAALVIVFSNALPEILGLYSVSIAAFIGGILVTLAIFYVSRLITGTLSVTYMLLAGIAINALTASGTGFLTYMSNDQELRTFTFWIMGSLGGALWPSVIVAATLIIPPTCLLIYYAKDLNLLILGDNEAQSLGVSIESLKKKIIFCTALAVGTAVSISGIIGFIGLVIPHFIRLAISPNHKVLLPLSALLGATLLVLADTLSRMVIAPAEFPVGILTSLIGGPFFLWLLIRQDSGKFNL